MVEIWEICTNKLLDGFKALGRAGILLHPVTQHWTFTEATQAAIDLLHVLKIYIYTIVIGTQYIYTNQIGGVYLLTSKYAYIQTV